MTWPSRHIMRACVMLRTASFNFCGAISPASSIIMTWMSRPAQPRVKVPPAVMPSAVPAIRMAAATQAWINLAFMISLHSVSGLFNRQQKRAILPAPAPTRLPTRQALGRFRDQEPVPFLLGERLAGVGAGRALRIRHRYERRRDDKRRHEREQGLANHCSSPVV